MKRLKPTSAKMLSLAVLLMVSCNETTTPTHSTATPYPPPGTYTTAAHTHQFSPPTLTPKATSSEHTDPCAHPLWPLYNGTVWTYNLSGVAHPKHLVFTATTTDTNIALVVNDQASLFNCTDGAIVDLPPGPVGHPDLGDGIDGINSLGSYLPTPSQILPLGTPAAWDLELEPTGVIVLPFNGVLTSLPIVRGKLVLFHTTGGLTTVNVPAGDYTVLLVQQNIFFDIQVHTPNSTMQNVVISTVATLYYAAGLGLVRVDYQGGSVSTQEGGWLLQDGARLELLSVEFPP